LKERYLTLTDHTSDAVNLRERLQYILADSDRPVVFVLGSGVSRGVVPDVPAMTDRFVSVLSAHVQNGLREGWREENTTPTKMYQDAALTVGSQRGDRVLGGIIREAVLEAYTGAPIRADSISPVQSRSMIDADLWNLPKAQGDLGAYIAGLSADNRRAVITTNFDPLTEVALKRSGLDAHPIPIPYDDPPSLDQINHNPAFPVLHIHGYFADQWSQNAIRHIRGARPQLEEVLSQLISAATVIVLGYGAWDDAFMKVLTRHAAQRTILNAEIIWCSHSESASEELNHPTIRRLLDGPGFSLYRGIDASDIFDFATLDAAPKFGEYAPQGWTSVPSTMGGTEASYRRFAEGALPTWADAVTDAWPLLSKGQAVLNDAIAAVEGQSNALIAITGPTGEGKSTALRQVAVALTQQYEDVAVYWREQGAPSVRDWLTSEARWNLRKVVLCIDEADLARGDLDALVEAQSADSDLIVVVACQDRLWWNLSVSRNDLFKVTLFDGIVEDDASLIASSWISNGVVSGTRIARRSVAAIAEELIAAGGFTRGRPNSTLFGAILEVRDAEGLQARIADLMDKLYKIRIGGGSPATLGDVFSMICVLEQFGSHSRVRRGGATRELISAAANVGHNAEGGAILRALGREATITFEGDYVFSRHPRIAASVVAWLQRNNKLNDACEFTARVGGRMKQEGDSARAAYQDAYFLASTVGSGDPAKAAARGAIQGAPEYMEPRINYLTVVRRFDLPAAIAYGNNVVKALEGARDVRMSARVLLNELAILDMADGKPRRALGLAALILHNGTGLMLVVARGILDDDAFRKYVATGLSGVDADIAQSGRSFHANLSQLAALLSAVAREAIEERELPYSARSALGRSLAFSKRLDFSDLALFERR